MKKLQEIGQFYKGSLSLFLSVGKYFFKKK